MRGCIPEEEIDRRLHETRQLTKNAQRIAETYLNTPEYVNDPAKYPFLPEVLFLSRAYLELLKQVEDQKDALWVWSLAPTVKLDNRRTIREQRLEAEGNK